jgi:hypothetical protein
MTPEEKEEIFGGGLVVFSSNLREGLLAQKRRAEQRKAEEKPDDLQPKVPTKKGPDHDR